MGHTKKVSTAGRYGARYGTGIRKRIIKVEKKQKVKEACPKCGFKRLKRISSGIFICRKCALKFAGGAYFPNTLTGGIVGKMIAQKSFSSGISELEAVKNLGINAEALKVDKVQRQGSLVKIAAEESKEKEISEKQGKVKHHAHAAEEKEE